MIPQIGAGVKARYSYRFCHIARVSPNRMMPIAARKSIVSRSARIVVSVTALSWVNRICWRTQIINPLGGRKAYASMLTGTLRRARKAPVRPHAEAFSTARTQLPRPKITHQHADVAAATGVKMIVDYRILKRHVLRIVLGKLARCKTKRPPEGGPCIAIRQRITRPLILALPSVDKQQSQNRRDRLASASSLQARESAKLAS